MQSNISFDAAWQNADGTVKALSRAEVRALTPEQRSARVRAKDREYARRVRTSRLHGRECEAEIETRRQRSELLRARRERTARAINDTARIERERRARSMNHPAFPPPPGATIDQEIRLRYRRATETNRRPTHGYL